MGMHGWWQKIPRPLWALALYVLTVLGLIGALRHFHLIAIPVFLSALLAYLLSPVVEILTRRTRWPRFLLCGLVTLLTVVLFAAAIYFFVPYLIRETEGALATLPDLVQSVSGWMERMVQGLAQRFPDLFNRFHLGSEIEAVLRRVFGRLSDGLWQAGASLYNAVITLLYMVLIPFFMYYFLKDAGRMRQALVALVPPRHQEAWLMKGRQVNHTLAHYLRGQFTIVLILMVLYATGLSLLGIPFAVLIGIFAGLGDIIPYFGTVCGLIVSLIVSLAHFHSLESCLLVIALFALVKGLENWFLYPRIVGKRIGLHFLWVLTALVIFGMWFGFWGLVVSIPASAGLRIFLHDLIVHYQQSAFYNRRST